MLGKNLRLEKPASGRSRGWQILPNGEHVTIWDMSEADAVDTTVGSGSKRYIFQIDFIDGVAKGCRAVFFGEHYEVLEVSDSTKRLRGLELRCEKAA